jgi:hypothetical protein
VFDYKSKNGDILFWQLGDFIRLTSRISSAVHVIDFEDGYDIIVPSSISDSELGKHIFEAFDASKIVRLSDLPKLNAAKEKKQFKEWKKELLDVAGLKRFSGFTPGQFRVVPAERNADYIRFSNSDCKTNPDDPRQYLPNDPNYKELLLDVTASVEQIGYSAKDALNACTF